MFRDFPEAQLLAGFASDAVTDVTALLLVKLCLREELKLKFSSVTIESMGIAGRGLQKEYRRLHPFTEV